MDFLAGLQDLAADDYTWAFSRACKLDGWLPNQDERHEAQTLLAAV